MDPPEPTLSDSNGTDATVGICLGNTGSKQSAGSQGWVALKSVKPGAPYTTLKRLLASLVYLYILNQNRETNVQARCNDSRESPSLQGGVRSAQLEALQLLLETASPFLRHRLTDEGNGKSPGLTQHRERG